jgi:hypothetical protein
MHNTSYNRIRPRGYILLLSIPPLILRIQKLLLEFRRRIRPYQTAIIPYIVIMRLNIGVCHSFICISIDASLLIINIWNIYVTVFIVLLVVLVYVFVKLAYFYLLDLQFVFFKTFHNSYLLHLWKILYIPTFNWSISSCTKSSFVRDFALIEFILN